MTTASLTDEQQAAFLRESSAAAYLATSAGPCFGDSITPAGFRQYLEDLRREAGSPTHPVPRMLIEQLAMVHHSAGRIHSRVAEAKTLDEFSAYSAVLVKLLAEQRLLGETLHRLSKHDTTEATHEAPRPNKKADRRSRPKDSGKQHTQLTSNAVGDSDEPTIVPITQSTPRRRRAAKSTAAAGAFG